VHGVGEGNGFLNIKSCPEVDRGFFQGGGRYHHDRNVFKRGKEKTTEDVSMKQSAVFRKPSTTSPAGRSVECQPHSWKLWQEGTWQGLKGGGLGNETKCHQWPENTHPLGSERGRIERSEEFPVFQGKQE